jgi:CRISPR-associated protein Csb1
LGILRRVEVYKGAKGWDVTKDGAGAKAKQVRPSEINHGNIAPSVQPLGVTCDRLEHTFVLSFACLRRLRFGSDQRNSTGRSLLAALGLLAVTDQDARGYSLRSRCDLVCDGRTPFEIVNADGSRDDLALSRDKVLALYSDAFDAAKAAGFDFSPEPIRLQPQDKLVAIVRTSQELALSGEGGEGEDGGEDNA